MATDDTESAAAEDEGPKIEFPPIVMPDGYEHVDPFSYDFENCVTRIDRNSNTIYFIDDVLAAVVVSGGNFAKMSILLGRPRNGVRNFVYKTPAASELLENVNEGFLDTVEHGYRYQAIAGDGAASRFFLQSLGKNRGFGSQVQVNADLSGSIGITRESPRESILSKLAGIATSKEARKDSK